MFSHIHQELERTLLLSDNCFSTNLQAAKGTASITSFYSQQKKSANTAALPSKDTLDMPELLREARPPRGLAVTMGGDARTVGAVAGWPGGGAPGGGLGDTTPVPQPRQGPLRGMPASRPADDSWQSAFKPVSTALSQPGSECNVAPQSAAQLQAETSSADVSQQQMSASNVEEEVLFQSPYAMRLRQQQGGQAAELCQMHSSFLEPSREDADANPLTHTGKQPDHCCAVDLAGSSPRAKQHQDKPAAKQCQHRPLGGHFEIGTSLGHPPRSPDAMAARVQLFNSPKRSIRPCEEEEPLTILSDSQSQEEWEITLPSPSPAKRCADITSPCN